jgi:hypothetical protein
VAKIGGPHDGDDETRARILAWELELEDRALEQFPELRKLGTFGDPAFEDALDRAVDLIDADGGKSTAQHDLELDLQEMELGADDSEETPGDATAHGEGGCESCEGRR